MGRVVTQSRSPAFQTLCQALQTIGQAFSFPLNPQNLDRVL